MAIRLGYTAARQAAANMESLRKGNDTDEYRCMVRVSVELLHTVVVHTSLIGELRTVSRMALKSILGLWISFCVASSDKSS